MTFSRLKKVVFSGLFLLCTAVYAQEGASACSDLYLEQLGAECDCVEKKPDKAWKDEEEYTKCVEKVVELTVCDSSDVIETAGCLPFDDQVEVTCISVLQETITSAAEECDCVEKKPGKVWKDENEYIKCVEKTIGKSPCDLDFVVGVIGCLPLPTPSPTLQPVCDYQTLSLLVQVCDCSEKKPGKPWKNEAEYVKCVDRAVKDTVCDTSSIIESSGCLPFTPATSSPTVEPPSCIDFPQFEQLAQVCDCSEKNPGKPWKNEAEYVTCVDRAVKDTVCDTVEIIEIAGCLPFPTLAPTTTSPTKAPPSCNDFPQLGLLAQVCDCDEKKPGKAWKNEEEYMKCVEDVVKDTFCSTDDIISISGCFPFSRRRLNDPRKH